MPYVLIVLFLVHQPGTFVPRVDHMDSIRFDDEQACHAAQQLLQNKLQVWRVPGQDDPNNLAINCIPAKSVQQ